MELYTRASRNAPHRQGCELQLNRPHPGAGWRCVVPATTRQRWLNLIIILLSALAFLPTRLTAQTSPVDALKEAHAAEKGRNWLQACKLYNEALRKDRTQAEAREGYQRCLRHYRQVRRLSDPGYRPVVNRLSLSEALDLYKQVLDVLSSKYVERE